MNNMITNRRRWVPIIRYKRIIGKKFKRNGLRPGWSCSFIPYHTELNIVKNIIKAGWNHNVYGTQQGFTITYYYLRKYYAEV